MIGTSQAHDVREEGMGQAVPFLCLVFFVCFDSFSLCLYVCVYFAFFVFAIT
jgi:hypothetical protein